MAVFLAAFALGVNGRVDGRVAGLFITGAYGVAVVHHLRNEWAASAYALRLARGWPSELQGEARARLGAALGVYVGEWALLGLVVLLGLALVACRG